MEPGQIERVNSNGGSAFVTHKLQVFMSDVSYSPLFDTSSFALAMVKYPLSSSHPITTQKMSTIGHISPKTLHDNRFYAAPIQRFFTRLSDHLVSVTFFQIKYSISNLKLLTSVRCQLLTAANNALYKGSMTPKE